MPHDTVPEDTCTYRQGLNGRSARDIGWNVKGCVELAEAHKQRARTLKHKHLTEFGHKGRQLFASRLAASRGLGFMGRGRGARLEGQGGQVYAHGSGRAPDYVGNAAAQHKRVNLLLRGGKTLWAASPW